MVAAKITSKGQITIPKEVRDRLGVKPGDSLEFAFEGDRLEVKPKKRRSIREFYGIFPPDKSPAGRRFSSWAEERELAWSDRLRYLATGDRGEHDAD
jgi:antitoxin PrlF